jgi:TolB-like protein
VAVLPFVNVGGDAGQDYFSDGLAEDIITHLSRSPWLLVVARNSSFNYRASSLGMARIGQELGARYVVHGSVRRAGDTLRMTAELVDTHAAQTLWSERYDRPMADLFALQEQISGSVASAIEPVYLRREEHLARQLSHADLQHWDMLMQARWHFWRSTQDNNQKAQDLLTQAQAIKPDDSPTLALLAFTHLAQVWGSWTPDARASIAQANRLAMSAVRHDDTDAFAHFTLGTALSCTGQMGLAIAELERALVLYPQFAAAAGELGRLLVFAGRADEAEEYVLQAIDASPHDPHMSLWVRTRALACFSLGDLAQALRYASLATSQRPDWFFNHFLLAAVQAAGGNVPAGQASMAHALAMGPYSKQAMRIGHPFVHAHDMQRFEAALVLAGWGV